MYILLLPEDETLSEFVADLDADSWKSWLDSFSPVEMELALPRFSLELDLSLNDVLKNLGIERAFVPGQADFPDFILRHQKLQCG